MGRRQTQWGPETHAQFLYAIFGSGMDKGLNLNNVGLETIIAAWPEERGQAPTVSALSQQITAIRKQARKSGTSTRISGARPLSTRAGASGIRGVARPIPKSSRPNSGKSGSEAHLVNLSDADGEEDDEQKFKMKPRASTKPESGASINARRRELLSRAASKSTPRTGLSPSTGLLEMFRSTRETTPDVFEETTLATKAGANCLANDPFAKLPMWQRMQALKKKNMDDWNAKYAVDDEV